MQQYSLELAKQVCFSSFSNPCCVSLPVMNRQLLLGNDTKFDVLQARRKTGLMERHCDFLLVAINIFHSSYRIRKDQTIVLYISHYSTAKQHYGVQKAASISMIITALQT